MVVCGRYDYWTFRSNIMGSWLCTWDCLDRSTLWHGVLRTSLWTLWLSMCELCCGLLSRTRRRSAYYNGPYPEYAEFCFQLRGDALVGSQWSSEYVHHRGDDVSRYDRSVLCHDQMGKENACKLFYDVLELRRDQGRSLDIVWLEALVNTARFIFGWLFVISYGIVLERSRACFDIAMR